jgi:hypothetical protein
MAEEYQIIYVQPVVRGVIACFEKSPAHPGGEITIAWPMDSVDPPPPVPVALTPFVARRLGILALRQVPAPDKKSAKTAVPEAPTEPSEADLSDAAATFEAKTQQPRQKRLAGR